ncbi:hypothetical protein [Streptomyces sp. NPDC047525]|uniref:hypothetical protein n=1 Tax=Streptomyces sp. NPDC047525 TaxID=3155264 RepID=UPI0033FCA6CF
MTETTSVWYGRCPCGGAYRDRSIDVPIRSTTFPLVITDVGQGSCLLCDSRVYKASTLLMVEASTTEESLKLRR